MMHIMGCLKGLLGLCETYYKISAESCGFMQDLLLDV